MRLVGIVFAVVLSLSACSRDTAADQPSEADQARAADFCASEGEYFLRGMGLDQYDNPEGYDRCVRDTLKIIDCLLPSDEVPVTGAFIPPDCYNDGYM